MRSSIQDLAADDEAPNAAPQLAPPRTLVCDVYYASPVTATGEATAAIAAKVGSAGGTSS